MDFDNVSQEAINIAIAWDKLSDEMKAAMSAAILNNPSKQQLLVNFIYLSLAMLIHLN
jgi:hypothetical protein